MLQRWLASLSFRLKNLAVVREVGSVAAFGPTMSLGFIEYISVAAVTADIGSALTAGHFGK
ncbi:hypothetical protein, partial [Pseudomonas grimontii]|uniref:hypothetical protein n=1 Tax=Pseudomonas grimontii TaxID=129847 RepID=UPI00387B434E